MSGSQAIDETVTKRTRGPLPDPLPSVPETRLDKWLWAARFFKTRALAAEAVAGKKVEVNGEKVKRSRLVRPGDTLRIRIGPFTYLVTVRGASDRRRAASLAAELYEEDPEAKRQREWLAEQHRLGRSSFRDGEGRPGKKERRDIQRLKRGD